MKTTMMAVTLALCLAVAAPTATALGQRSYNDKETYGPKDEDGRGGAGDNKCNNYGVQVGVWVEGGNCNDFYCCQGTGAAAGAGAGGVGGDDSVGAEASAGSGCNQGSDESPAEEILDAVT